MVNYNKGNSFELCKPFTDVLDLLHVLILLDCKLLCKLYNIGVVLADVSFDFFFGHLITS